MTIQIEQTLHGYEVGHQLLMSSTNLSTDAKQTLLIQSDLSGSNVDEFFKAYLTGYPLHEFYAFSKTWYAEEMPRPGCVWTHTLLIALSDLGKIPDLHHLLRLFKRPQRGVYREYENAIVISRDFLVNEKLAFSQTKLETAVMSAVYEEPNRSILVPCKTAQEAEEAVLNIWSGQWPRLRRNFLFCTGALSPKYLDRREFDLQVVPRRNLVTFESQSPNGFTVTSTENIRQEWLEFLYKVPKNTLRRFLWTFGVDVPGVRKSYIPMVLLCRQALMSHPSLDAVTSIIWKSFKESKEAAKLKSNLFSNQELFNFQRKDVIYHLLSEQNLVSEEFHSIDIGAALVDAFNQGEFDITEFIDLYKRLGDRAPQHFWEQLVASDEDLLKMLTRDYRFIEIFEDRLLDLAVNSRTWQVDDALQFHILQLLNRKKVSNWDLIVEAIFDSKSNIMSIAVFRNADRIRAFLKCCNNFSYGYYPQISSHIFTEFKHVFIEFVRSNVGLLSRETIENVFKNLTLQEITSIGFDGKTWVNLHKRIEEEYIRVHAGCALLSLGFNRRVDWSVWVVLGCFSEVYHFAMHSKLSLRNWDVVPVDMSEEEEEPDFITSIFKNLNLFSPKKNEVPNWDYCELLLRTLVNKFIKYKWAHQILIDCLTTQELTERFVRYTLSFNKGEKLLRRILEGVSRSSVKIHKHQVTIFGDVRKRMKY